MSAVRVAVIQSSFSDDLAANTAKIAGFARQAAAQGAKLVLAPELFQGHYFCVSQEEAHFARAHPAREHPSVLALRPLCAELGVVMPVSIFERDGPHFYNSLVMIDADGSILGVYRKSHIPDGPGYQEKYYFRPGDTGFVVFPTAVGRLGGLVCWDQWFPEAARAMALGGAQVLLYPTAIGSEPHDPALDTRGAWRRAMQGHAASNRIPVLAANRVGVENGQAFYGTSFIAAAGGDILAELDDREEGVALADLDFAASDRQRSAWGFFRDRRPDLYQALVRGGAPLGPV